MVSPAELRRDCDHHCALDRGVVLFIHHNTADLSADFYPRSENKVDIMMADTPSSSMEWHWYGHWRRRKTAGQSRVLERLR